MNVISRGIRNAFRNSVRTFSIVIILALSIGLALTMLIARQAVTEKINSVKSSIGNTITVSPAGARGFEGGGEPLTDAIVATVKTVDHVNGVTSVLQARLESTDTSLVSAIEAGSLGRRNNRSSASGQTNTQQGPGEGGSFTPPVFLAGTNDLSGSVLMGGGSITMKSGEKFDPTKDEAVAVIGTTLATKNNLQVGSTFTAYGSTVKVVGIFDSGNNFSNNAVVMPLPAVQRLSSQAGQISSIVVKVDSIVNIDATTTALQSKLGSDKADVVSQQDTSKQALAPLESIKKVSAVSLIGALVAGAVIILLTMMMIVRERRREIGVLKAIGASNIRIMGQFIVESITFTSIAAIVGLGIGILAANPITKLLVINSSNSSGGGMGGGPGRAVLRGFGGDNLRSIHASVGIDILFYGLLAALIIAIVGSAIPSWLIAKVRPAEVMRAE